MPPLKFVRFDDEKIAYLIVPKTATTSIKVAFLDWLGIEHVGYSPEAEQHRLPLSPHYAPLPYSTGGQAVDLYNAGGWTFLAMVRHPLSRIVSAFHDPTNLVRLVPLGFRVGVDGFDRVVDLICRNREPVLDHHFGGQVEHLFRPRARPRHFGRVWLPDRLFKFEDLPDVWRDIQEIFAERSSRGPLPELQITRKNDHRPWPTYYTAEQLRRLARRFEREFSILADHGVRYEIPTVPG